MKQAPTLFDSLYRASFKNTPVNGWSNNAQWRTAIMGARRFVLDDPMSTFLGVLSTQAFTKTGIDLEVRKRIIENLRVGARLPHNAIWVEYNLRNCQAKSQELLGQPYNPLETPKYEGWLLQQHPHLETAFLAHIITHDPDTKHDEFYDTWTFPVALAWTADQDTILPWKALSFNGLTRSHSELLTGLMGYKTDRSAYVKSDMVAVPDNVKAITHLMYEWCGVLRRIWAFLSTINDLPVQVTEVRQPKGFVARGQYRKFLDHKTLTITVPQKHYLKIARNALAMAHRRGGPVRGHFRIDFRHLPSPLCEHEWIGVDDKHMECVNCKGRKIWIADFVRGDSSKGFVSHDYVVKHDPT
jgi:hypothetical protein